MQLAPGTVLLHYTLVEKLGEGGMGVVWKALDTSLDREVAIKVLPEALSQDVDRLARFEREAKLLAGLNHPNIAAVYSVHQVEGMRFLAMEFLPGEDLAQRLARGPLPVAEALRLALQIAEALEAAHDSGVIHRDLKPANIVVTPEGRVKVLDFGLAKAFDPATASSQSDLFLSPTVTSGGTMAGVILGTPGYMSPEQARGQAVDRRADIWAFGCVVVEMLTARRVFSGDTVSDTLAAVLKSEPDWATLPSGTPPEVRRLLMCCLRKDPARRLRDAGDVRVLVEESIAGGDYPLETTTGSARTGRIPWVVAGLLALLSIFLLWTVQGSDPAPRTGEPRHLALRLPQDLELDVNNESQTVAISPDGAHIAFVGNADGEVRLYVQALDGSRAVAVKGGERASHPFFSPDSQSIAFFAQGKLRKVSLRGGSPIDLMDSGINRGGVWLDDGSIILAGGTSSGLVRVSAAGGPAETLTSPDPEANERTHRWPTLLPDGKTVLFTIGTVDKPGNYEDADIGALSLETGERRVIYHGASMARYVSTGYLLIGKEGSLLAVPFDLQRLEATGDAVLVMQNVAGEASSGILFFDVSREGTLVYAERDPHATELKLVWVDREGNLERLPAPLRDYRSPRISPDGNRIAVAIGPGEGRKSDVWIYDIPSETLARLTFDQSSANPVWSRDGRHLAYNSRENGKSFLAQKPADGSGERDFLLSLGDSVPRLPASFTLDGKHLVYTDQRGRDLGGLFMLSIEEATVTPVVKTAATI